MTDRTYPSRELVAHWCALLDGELSPEQTQNLMAEVKEHPESREFLEGQKRFNDALGLALGATVRPAMPAEVRLRMLAQLKQETIEAQALSAQPALRVLSHAQVANSAANRHMSRRWAYSGMAAMLLVGLAIGALLMGGDLAGGSAKADGSTGGSARVPVVLGFDAGGESHIRKLEAIGGLAADLMLDLGERPEMVEEFARSHGYDAPIPQYPGNDGDTAMSSVYFNCGSVEGVRYQAFTLCAGVNHVLAATPRPGADKDVCPSKGRLQRIVMFIFEGDMRPAHAGIRPQELWLSQLTGRSFAARWDPVSQRTYLLYVPGNVDQERVRELATPLITVDNSNARNLR